jgi:flavin reductase (DIM6/NTAB) family NADH-FMN oxidoreductase RutF
MKRDRVDLDCTVPIWDRFYLVHQLVVIGTTEPDGSADFAPKHMTGPMSWDNYFGFVCCEDHATYRNTVRTGVFTVSYPTPDQIVQISFSSAPRSADDTKPSLEAIATVPARVVEGSLMEGSRVHLECVLERTVDGLGPNSLVIGRVVAAAVDETALRVLDREDERVISDAPLLAYLQPDRFSVIDDSRSFPFYSGWSR